MDVQLLAAATTTAAPVATKVIAVTISDWLIVLATIVGPVLAVQAQKWVERGRRVSDMRQWIFTTLMTTRADRLSKAHIEALNTISIAFHGSGRRFRPQRCQNVLNKWKEYLAHLSTPIGQLEGDAVRHETRRTELFTNLLEAIAVERGFEFDRVEISDGAYHPQGLVENVLMGNAVMRNALAVLEGQQALKIRTMD